MDRSANRHRSGVVCLALACLLGCGGAMTEVDDSTPPGDASGGLGGMAQGGAQSITTGTVAVAGSSAGGYTTIVLPPAGGAAGDYRCTTPVDSGEPCTIDFDVPTQSRFAFDPKTGMCDKTSFYGCGNSTASSAFDTVGTCEAVCRAAPSSSTCNLEQPTPWSTCAPETELCIYLATSYNVPCLCSDYTCATQRCPGILPMVTTPSDSCTDDVCVAQLPIVLLEETKTVCRCESGLWNCDATYRYGGGL